MREALDSIDEADDVMEQTCSFFLSDDYKEVTLPGNNNTSCEYASSTCFLVYMHAR